jgi:hypothetical protein
MYARGPVFPAPSHTPLKAPKPPSTGTTTPLTKSAPGPHSQTRVPTRSSGSPKRPDGVWSMIVWPRGRRPVLAQQERAVLLADEETGRDRVDPHPFAERARQLRSEPAGGVLDPGLRDAVADHARHRPLGRHRGDVDDGAPPAARHRLAKDLAWEQRALQVQSFHRVHILDRQLEEGLPRIEGGPRHVAAGRVDEHVEPPPPPHDGLARGFELTAVEHVGGQRHRFAAVSLDLPRGGLGLLSAAAQHSDLRAAEHPRAAGDDRDPSFQAEQLRR